MFDISRRFGYPSVHMSLTGFTNVVDHGPLYTETHPGRFPVEPWATYTNLIFLFIIAYWAIRIRRSSARHTMLRVGLVVLGIGWFGGTVYHATRSSDLWLVMDWMPIMILALMATFWFWRRITGYAMLATLAMTFSMLLSMLAHRLPGLKHGQHITVGYVMLALSILIPACLHCAIRWRAGWWRMALSLAAFGVAIVARELDSGLGARVLPMGSHFLWHIFGGISVFCLISYIYRAEEAATESLRPEKSRH